MTKDFIDTNDFTRAELADMLSLIGLLKTADRAGCLPEVLKGSALAMIFEEASTRTRISFEVGMSKLGGHALYLKPGEIHLGERESLGDTAKVISGMCDVIEARVLLHKTVVDLARFSSVAVINGLSDYNHPTQSLSDIFTISEHLPEGKTLEDCTVVFVGDRTNVCSSLMFICASFGMHFIHAAPLAYQSPPEWVAIAQANIAVAGHGSVTVTDNVEDAVAHGDFVYTDLWWWVGQESEATERKKAFFPRYQVNEGLMARAPHARFMHCLPASRGVEVTDAVIDGAQSIAFPQAQNRLYTEEALLVWFTRPHSPQDPPVALRIEHDAAIRSFIGSHLPDVVTRELPTAVSTAAR